MTYVLVSSCEIPSEGFTDLKQDLLLDDHNCHDYELSEEYFEELRALSKLRNACGGLQLNIGV
jgi:hypothetical protein